MNNEVLEKKINTIKEAMSNMPKKNIKNNQKYINYIEDTIKEVTNIKTTIEKEIKQRYDNLIEVANKESKIEINPNIETYYECLNLINTNNTPYEKSNLDKIIFEITNYNQNDFLKTNENLKKAIDIFKIVGITLKSKDFNYNIYVNKYMTVFLEELSKENISTPNLKKCFEEVYWKCPDLISDIAHNLSYLYYKNIKTFEKKYEELKTKKLKTLNMNEKNLKEHYQSLLEQENHNKNNTLNKILEKFINKTYNITDYQEEKIDSYHNQIGDKNKNIENLNNLLTSLKEYKHYQDYLYIINDIKEIYKEKAKYKDVFKNKLKDITKRNNKIINLTNKYQSKSKSKFFKNDQKLNQMLQNNENEILAIKPLYEELELDKFNELISKQNDNITLYDLLSIATSYYIYLRKIITTNSSDLSNELVDKNIEEIKKFILGFNVNIINNISINEERNIANIISDKYNLLDINITADNIENNLDNTIDTINKILLKDTIDKSPLKYEDIEFICNAQEIITKM